VWRIVPRSSASTSTSWIMPSHPHWDAGAR
jgi:hypothetical protein